jgi:hypothetical protein
VHGPSGETRKRRTTSPECITTVTESRKTTPRLSPGTAKPPVKETGRLNTVLRAAPPPRAARPVSRESPVDPNRDHRWGFPCCPWSPMRHATATPAGSIELIRSSVSIASGLPRVTVRSAPAIIFFEACSAFTRVTACTLAESPSDPLHRKLRQLRCLGCRFDCYRVERTSSRAGVAPAGVQRLSRRTVTPTTMTKRALVRPPHKVGAVTSSLCCPSYRKVL